LAGSKGVRPGPGRLVRVRCPTLISGYTEPPVEFRILGPLEMTVGSERLELGSSRQQAVIAALLLSPNLAISVDRLAEAM
jgi:hypothetical protein